ncbi:metalloregulator ArsR/SmtB family transcription factor [Nakamurella sp. YIM 132087]|uniref:Metalloregulator ArsR/SmtB family transcription factor n=1 Tax=Nakamurella alba TaxID=2665158 RepID=A0A7K1FJJ7_9ACTN|nr:metalloregulator ArsR/SmtB family transcription factor [Nakamurella alba]
MFAALGDDTRWGVLQAVGDSARSASALAKVLPVTRQAIARHLAVLEQAGLVEQVPVGREIRYRAVGATLSAAAHRLAAIGAAWDEQLAAIKRIAESL